MKKFNTSITKKIAVISLTAAAAFSFVGCNVSSTSTYTETITDSEGNTTTTTTTTTNGETTTETTEVTTTVATMDIDNRTNFEIAELYCSPTTSEEWDENILDGDTLPVGMVVAYDHGFTYSSDNTVWDMMAVDAEGNNIVIEGIDMTLANDPENILIVLEYDDATQEYSATIQ